MDAMGSGMSDAGGNWRAWIEEQAHAMGLLARQWTHTHADAEDVVQDALVRFWETGRHAARDPKAYLYACVKSAAVDLERMRQRRQERERVTREQWRPEPMFETDLERSEWCRAVEDAIHQLPVEQREVVVLKIWGGLTFAQISEALGVPLKTAASRYEYSLRRLRHLLDAEGSGSWTSTTSG